MNKEIVYSYIKEIAYRLKDKKKYGAASVMVGAGFSKNAENIHHSNLRPPNWTELAEKMYCELYPKTEDMSEEDENKWNQEKIINTSGKNVTKLAEEYIVTFDRNRMNRLVEENISDESYKPGKLHNELLKLDWEDVFTTNYDTLLERATKSTGKPLNYKLITSQYDLPGSTSRRIIKLHGSIPHIKPYIISEEDYRTYPYKYSAFVNTVQQSMLETRLCLIGFSGDDPNFQSWLGWLRDNMGENCPKIYLFGIYNDIKEPVKRLLEKKEIVVIDLSVLVDKNENNIHYLAFNKFFEKIQEYQEMLSVENINNKMYDERPYKDIYYFEQIQSRDNKYKSEYIKAMIKFSEKVYESINSLILLPEEIRKKYAEYFKIHFEIVLKMDKSDKNLTLISLIIKILRQCLEMLDDYGAKGLEEYVEKYFIGDLEKGKDNIKLDYICEILLYLVQMYRIDGNHDKYDNCMEKLEICAEKLSYKANDILFEKAINYIGYFDYKKAKDVLYKISEENFAVKLRKACMLKQLSDNDTANNILNKCSSELAHMNISDELYASFLGYLNLCYRSENIILSIEKEFSDEDTYYNKYNTRNIINKLSQDISYKFFEEEENSEDNILPFNLNTKRSIITISSRDLLNIKSFNLILAIEKLGLKTFSEQNIIMPKVIDKIIESSDSKYWKASIVIRTNNEKIINKFFTRETIQTMKKEDIKLLFDSMSKLLKLFENSNNYLHKRYIITQKILTECLSRLCIFLPDDDVVVFIKYLSNISNIDCDYSSKYVRDSLNRIKTRFNTNIANKIQNIIFKEFNYRYRLASYFEKIEISDENINEYYINTIENCKSKEILERDNAISQLILLWNNKRELKYRDNIINAIYDNPKDIFPRTDSYYPFIWERLPHKDELDFSRKYYDYLLQYEFIEGVNKSTIQYNKSLNSVQHYKIFYFNISNFSYSEFKKITIDKKLNISMLEKIDKFLLNEKSILKKEYDVFGDKKIVEFKFREVGELVGLIYFNAIYNDILNEDTLDKINKIKNFLIQENITIDLLIMIDNIKTANYNKCIENLKNILFSKNKKYYSDISIGMPCLLYYLRKNNIKEYDIKEELLDILSLLKYLDIENAKSIWMNISICMQDELFEDLEFQDEIAESINQCIDLYKEPAQKGQRYFMDGLYNCIVTLRDYYYRLYKNDIKISPKLEEVIKGAKNIDNEEIKNIFKD